MADQRVQTFTGDGRPYFQCVVIGTGDDAIAAELQARDDVVVVRFENFRITNWSRAPIHFDDVLSHVGRLPWRRHRRHGANATTFRSIGGRFDADAALFTLLLPQQIVVAQETPTAACLRGAQ